MNQKTRKLNTVFAQAQRMLHKVYGPNAKLYRSTKSNKKYMVYDPHGHVVHFGQKGYQDYTAHKAKARRSRFRKRNRGWATAKRWTPAHLSYYVLW